MGLIRIVATLGLAVVAFSPVAAREDPLDPALQAKVDAKFVILKELAKNPITIGAVKAHNTTLPPEHAAMTQEKWQTFSVIHPFVASFAQNEAAKFLGSRKGDQISEIFLSDARGLKVAFFAKPSSWSHKGKPKHDLPMTGKTWQGGIEIDESTGVREIQIGVPVFDGGRPIGSLVAGLNVAKLS